jgi:hypothetical protein
MHLLPGLGSEFNSTTYENTRELRFVSSLSLDLGPVASAFLTFHCIVLGS